MEYKDKNLQEIIDLSELYLSYLLEGNEFILSVKRHIQDGKKNKQKQKQNN